MSIPFPSFSSEIPVSLLPPLQAFLEASKDDQTDFLEFFKVFATVFELVLKVFQAFLTAVFLSFPLKFQALLKSFNLVWCALVILAEKALNADTMLFSLAITAFLTQAASFDEADEDTEEKDDVEVALVVVAILLITRLSTFFAASLTFFSALVSAEAPETTKLKAKTDNNDTAKIFLFI